MWNDLRDRFSQQNGPRIFQIQKAISAITQENQSEYILQFLMGLNDSFSHVRGQILLMDPLPPINKVFSLLVQDERQRMIFGSIDSMFHNTTAMMVNNVKVASSSSNSSPAYASTRFGKSNVIRKDRPTCTHCGVYGHTVEKCYRLHGFPPGFKFTKGRPAANHSVHQVSDLESSRNLSTNLPASLPIIQEQIQQLLALLQPKSDMAPPVIQAGEHQSHLVSQMSGTFFPIQSPHSVFSSISSFQVASQFENNPWIIDTGATDHMHLLTWRMIGVGKEHEGLFYLVNKPVQPASSTSIPVVSLSVKNVSSDVWHYRLGHLSSSRLKLLSQLDSSISVDSNKCCTI
ncbi:uncharacterized protein LOC132174541 [Corylus avellana]|uniref:uncharacterized protein LOC132174541 n=1 Tax=Corylus avellana TaxID=13451 RepID=UPI00286CB336|nr:uncharacterized protein LOC132174541 [Corylus avellana]